MRPIYIIFLIELIFASCIKSSESTFKNVKGTLGSAQGCSEWIIRQDNGVFWQPLNLNSFQVTLKGGQSVIFSFNIKDTVGTFCMTGDAIELISIQDK